jgi:subtilisin family serine protease
MNAPRQPGNDRPRTMIDPLTTDRRPISRRPGRAAALSADPLLSVSPVVLARYNARVLNPPEAARVAGQTTIRSTVYISVKLLVGADADDDLLGALEKAARSLGLTVVRSDGQFADGADAITARRAGGTNARLLFPVVVQLQPVPGASAPVDAWEVLQAFRAGRDPESSTAQVGLDHLLTATRHIVATPFDEPQLAATPRSSYAEAGWGGRAPVNWLGSPPARTPKLRTRRPVVAVLDTGCGRHPWLPDDIVDRAPTVDGAPDGILLGLPTDATELTGVLSDPLEGDLDSDAGHGTFICGLIRQLCPDADILAVRVVPSDGAVPEHVLLDALGRLLCRQQRAQDGSPELFVDVVSLSMGYYHEQTDDPTFDTFLRAHLDALARTGAAVVASAGNDATTRPMFPAAFTPHGGGVVGGPDADCVPLISVGATNPDGSVALFSNAGDWVACHRPGADLVSTFPITFDASGQAAYHVSVDGQNRSTIDPDNFGAGFGTWSGTSFAAPVLAGQLAQTLVGDPGGSLEDVDAPTTVARTWAAVTAQVGVVRP